MEAKPLAKVEQALRDGIGIGILGEREDFRRAQSRVRLEFTLKIVE